MWWSIFLPLSLILLSNRFFSVGPWWHQQSVFNVADIGNGMTAVALGFFVIFSKYRKNLLTSLSVFVFFYLCLVVVHLVLAHINYGQSYLNGLIAIRHQFYFASFFLFLFLFNDSKNIIRFMDVLIVIAVIILILSLLNYLGVPILSHKWAKGQGIRAGVIRTFIPGMSFISFVTLWLFAKWLGKNSHRLLAGSTMIIFLTAHFVRQTRMRLLWVTAIILSILVLKRKWKELFALAVIAVGAFFLLEISMKINPVTENIRSAFSNFSQQTGTWKSRSMQLKIDKKVFLNNPLMGDGLSAVREHGRNLHHIKSRAKSFKSDLGYSSWLKFYGVVGGVWLLFFFGIQLFMLGRIYRKTEDDEKTLALFSFCYICYTLGTFVSINSLMYPEGIVLTCLVASFIVLLYQKMICNKETRRPRSLPAQTLLVCFLAFPIIFFHGKANAQSHLLEDKTKAAPVTVKSKAGIDQVSQLFVKKNNNYLAVQVDGFELPDFSYAGYGKGERAIPDVAVTYQIRPIEGFNDEHIQSALRQAEGGALLLGPGTYRIRSEIIIPPRTVLRGSGPEGTFLFVDTDMTHKMSALVANRSRKTHPKLQRWQQAKHTSRIDIQGDVAKKSSVLHTTSSPLVAGFSVGDRVVVRNEVNDAFRLEYNGVTHEKGKTIWPKDYSALKFLREIRGIEGNTVVLDQPIPHVLNSRDRPHILKADYMAEEIGIEDLAIGFRQTVHGSNYRDVLAKGAQASFHASNAILFGNVVNGWVRNVKSYTPSGDGFHLHSRGIVLSHSRNITVEHCDLGQPANRGSGGNGYLYAIVSSSDCMIKDSIGREGRHNFLFHFTASGNVISNCTSILSQLANDFHHSLATANLIENMKIINESGFYAWEILNRKHASAGAGVTGTDNVFWGIKIAGKVKNSRTLKIRSQQAKVNGKGYVIGVTDVRGSKKSQGTEWREWIGQEDRLTPVSLYQAQLRARLRL